MCCPVIVALVALSVFLLGYVFGRWSRIDSGKGSWDESGGIKHRNVFENDLNREEEVVFFMTKSGTKVHLMSHHCQELIRLLHDGLHLVMWLKFKYEFK